MEQLPRILVVDDEVDCTSNLRDILEDMGYIVDVANDGNGAIELAREHQYDIALLDLRMPGMDGLELFRELKKLPACPIGIILTAFATHETAEAALKLGAWKVMPKPVDLSNLFSIIDSALDRPLVLIVDDDTDMCASLSDILATRNYRFRVAHDVQGLQQQLDEQPIQIVLIDMKLANESGSEVFQIVKSKHPDAATILITGYREENQQEINSLLEQGATEVHYKPFEIDQLLATIRRLAS